MYVDASVIVDGALVEDAWFYDETLLNEWVRGVQEDAEGHGYLTEIFLVWHEHDPSVEDCACVQYLSDHRPSYVFNGEES